MLGLSVSKTGEKCGEILANFFADFRPSISREGGRKKFTQTPPHIRTSNSTGPGPTFFHCDTLGVSRPNVCNNIHSFQLVCIKIAPTSANSTVISVKIPYVCFGWIKKGFHHLTPKLILLGVSSVDACGVCTESL